LEARFVVSDASDPEEAALEHFNHIFGIFHSPTLISRFRLDPDLVGGLGAPLLPIRIKVLGQKQLNEGVEVRYEARGMMILHKKVASRALSSGSLELPMPYNLEDIYNVKCTDEYYSSESDYWYFYDPYRKGCEYLQREPYAQKVRVALSPFEPKKPEENPRLDLIRKDNGNGNLFSISVVHGFAEPSRSRNDEGRVNHREFGRELKKLGFQEKVISNSATRQLSHFTKDLEAEDGTLVPVLIKTLLVSTEVDSRSTSFAKFFKEAVENDDVVIYLGHSGLGGNLDIPSLEDKAGAFSFNPKKRQIFFFESCSSYSYYLSTFRSEKRKAKLDIMTNGLSSYFATSTPVLMAFVNTLLDLDSSPDWTQILREMEKPLDGGTYLLNVGGI
jgi:hypothetical protein